MNEPVRIYLNHHGRLTVEDAQTAGKSISDFFQEQRQHLHFETHLNMKVEKRLHYSTTSSIIKCLLKYSHEMTELW